MARPNPIRKIMTADLPGITYQRRKSFRPTVADVDYAYKICNRYLFDNKLIQPVIDLKTTRKAWGWCNWGDEIELSGSYCHIRLMNKWFCPQWFLNTLAHEMVHQWQWDVYRWDKLAQGEIMFTGSGGHGPSFFSHKDRFDYYGLTLKTSYGQKRWFRHQDFTRC